MSIVKEVSVKVAVIGFVAALLLISGFIGSSASAFEPGSFGLNVGGGMNFPMLDFADQSALGATLGFGFGGGATYQLGEQLAIVGSYSLRIFDTHFLEPPTGYQGGYSKYRMHSFTLNPRIYLNDEGPCAFIEFGVGGYLPYFYIPGDASEMEMLSDELELGLNFGYGWHSDKIDLALRYHIFKTSPTSLTPSTYVHYLTFDAMLNLIPQE